MGVVSVEYGPKQAAGLKERQKFVERERGGQESLIKWDFLCAEGKRFNRIQVPKQLT